MCISADSLMPYFFSLSLPLHMIYVLDLLSTNHKCTQACYLTLLLKLAAQKEKMNWNSSTRSSRLCVAPGYHSCGVMESSAIPFHGESS
jgi:hypothetical protein